MKTLQTTEENAQKAYDAADSNGKKMLEALWPELAKPKSIMERVKTFEDVCAIAGLAQCPVVTATDTPDEIAYKKLKLIVQVLNEGWKANWKDDDEYKYYPWFDFSGSSLSFHDYVFSSSASIVGSRLCFKSSELAEYAGKQFLDIYSDFMTF